MGSDRAAFIWDRRLTQHVYRPDHPLKPLRLVGVHETLTDLGAFDRANAVLLPPRDATRSELERIHAPEYVEAVLRGSADPGIDLGAWGMQPWGDTPPFVGMHEASLLTTGASLVAMEEVLRGAVRVAVNYAGGLHHAMRARASRLGPGSTRTRSARNPAPKRSAAWRTTWASCSEPGRMP